MVCRIIAVYLLSVFYFLFYEVAALASPVPDTGQTACYNAVGSVIACPAEGEAYYGQDGNYLINPPSYTKLGENGVELPGTATQGGGWIMTRDNVTGLVWEMKTDDGSIHDKDNTYTWCDPDPATNGGNQGTCGNGTDTDDFINALNAAGYGGYSDWRLPAREELRSIVDYGRYNPAVNTTYLPNTVSSYYWSSTTGASSTGSAWRVHFYFGYDEYDDKSNGNYVRAVRAGQ